MIKTDCFAYTKRRHNGSCKIMKDGELICENKNCTFYKSFEQYIREIDKYSTGEKNGTKLMFDIDGAFIEGLIESRKIKFVGIAAQMGVSIDTLRRAIRTDRASGNFIAAVAQTLDTPAEALRRV